MTNVFDLRETKLCFLGVDSGILSAKPLEYLSDVYESIEDLVLKVWARS